MIQRPNHWHMGFTSNPRPWSSAANGWSTRVPKWQVFPSGIMYLNPSFTFTINKLAMTSFLQSDPYFQPSCPRKEAFLANGASADVSRSSSILHQPARRHSLGNFYHTHWGKLNTLVLKTEWTNVIYFLWKSAKICLTSKLYYRSCATLFAMISRQSECQVGTCPSYFQRLGMEVSSKKNFAVFYQFHIRK